MDVVRTYPPGLDADSPLGPARALTRRRAPSGAWPGCPDTADGRAPPPATRVGGRPARGDPRLTTRSMATILAALLAWDPGVRVPRPLLEAGRLALRTGRRGRPRSLTPAGLPRAVGRFGRPRSRRLGTSRSPHQAETAQRRSGKRGDRSIVERWSRPAHIR